MKIILITEDYPPTSGGIAQWAYGVTQELLNLGHEVRVLTRAGIFEIENTEIGNEEIIKMSTWQWRNLRSIYIAFYLLRELFRQKADIVIASTWNIGAFATDLKKKFKYKTILAYHGLEVTKHLNPKRRMKLIRALENSDLNVAVSRFTKQEIIKKYNINKNRITVLPNGVDINRFYPEEKSLELIKRYQLEDKKILLTLSRVIERKGHDIVLKSLPGVIKNIPNLVYIIAGVAEVKFKEKLDKLIQDLKLENYVFFSGALENKEILPYYNLCDLYIMVSKGSGEKGDSEGFGITYLEANACKKAVIGSNVDGIPDAIENMNNGLLVEAENVKETADSIVKLMSDEELRKKLGENGLFRIKENYTWGSVTKQMLKVIND